MTVHLAIGSATTDLSDAQIAAAVRETLAKLGARSRVLAVPPDATRAHSKAGPILGAVAAHYGAALTDVLPALGTHVPMTPAQIAGMYPAVPPSLFRIHDWRRDVVTIGEIPGSEVRAITEGIWDRPWPAQLNKLIWQGGHDLILSIGQVVPHEVAGMANGVKKNLLHRRGHGRRASTRATSIGAAYGMEQRMMGRAATPVRLRLLDLALERFCTQLTSLFLLTVVGPDGQGRA